MKRGDIFLIIVIILLASGLLARNIFFLGGGDESSSRVIISVDGERFGEYSLFEEQEIVVEFGNEYNVVKIENKRVTMMESNCDNQVCVETHPISKGGQSIVCLPHRVVVEISTGSEGEIDGISR